MAKIKPFKAIRPIRDKAHLVATRPYYTYKKKVLEAKLMDNPFTFLHIINPEFGVANKTAPNSVERFEHVKEAYNHFLKNNVLKQDEEPSLYIYKQTFNGHEYVGIVGGASVEEYNNDRIKKHEATITSREQMFTEYLDIVGYNAEPVLLSYSGTDEIDQFIYTCTLDRPEFEFTTTDLKKHELWVLSSKDSEMVQSLFEKVDNLYIADGHHRSASSSRLQSIRTKKGSNYSNENYFLSFIINEKKLDIIEFNRMSKTLNNHSPDEFLNLLSQNFLITPLKKGKKPSSLHEFTMFLDNNWYQLEYSKDRVNKEHPVKSLDAQILTETILDPILGIKDLKHDDNIDFWPGNISLKKIEKSIKSNKFKVGFVLYPVSIHEVKNVADNHMIMPPKSTWVEPKLRSGLTIYNINE